MLVDVPVSRINFNPFKFPIRPSTTIRKPLYNRNGISVLVVEDLTLGSCCAVVE
jgi:hypothetical protein